eukprot:CAMPEP_0185719562 /NCGR_PEP_ID=MMETSP1164-20130828/48994_1 /TAXON_ID=1104430 /ORGANISM="Chrysoreinhardia sp, Strain CCMP2950" /LENGTH=109 /DNA_ID=CAMNT_0028387223 /DNA_START=33 /DNA_END=359 /DNA_ORIENTATION=-
MAPPVGAPAGSPHGSSLQPKRRKTDDKHSRGSPGGGGLMSALLSQNAKFAEEMASQRKEAKAREAKEKSAKTEALRGEDLSAYVRAALKQAREQGRAAMREVGAARSTK